jgi:ribokinase
MITVVGSVNLDTIAVVANLPRPGETVSAVSVSTAHGGKGANQAVAAARMGADVAFVGCVGSDAAGPELVDRLADEGVDVTHVATTGRASGFALITIDEIGENTIVVAPGANALVALDEASRDVVRSASVVLCQLEIPMPTVIDAAEAAEGLVVLNAAPAVPVLPRLLEAVDVLIVNETELRELTGAPEPASARSLGVPTVVVTLGAAGAQVVTSGDIGYVRAPVVTVRDTTGAGDTFCGAFAAAIEEGRDVFEAATMGVIAGSLATTKLGAREAMPTKRAVQRMLEVR